MLDQHGTPSICLARAHVLDALDLVEDARSKYAESDDRVLAGKLRRAIANAHLLVLAYEELARRAALESAP
jgi:hypothetical protein